MDYQAIYQSKKGTLEGALALVHSGDTIMTSMFGNEPVHFLSQLHTIAPRVEGVCLWSMVTMHDYPVVWDTSLKGKIDILSTFYNAACRKGQASGRYSFVPVNLHAASAGIIAAKRPTVYVAAVSPMSEDGTVSISFDLEMTLECMEAADTVIFEVNPNMPRVFGECAVPITAADYVYEAESPLPISTVAPPTPEDLAIAEYVASLVYDGDCIQLGIGSMPNAIGERLLGKRDLGIHTEMLTLSMGKLIDAGVVTNARKNLNPGVSIAVFAHGDETLYRHMTENPALELRRASYVNDPFIIAQNDNMVSINTALELDLTGQICSESIGHLQYTGTGGAMDFAWGAFHSKGGRGIIAIHSTAKNGTVSKIRPSLSPGAIVSIPRNLADYVVTEYGIAKLRDRSIRDRVNSLIAIAHPDFRAELRRQADQLMLW